MDSNRPKDLADAVFRENHIPMTERNAALFGWLRAELEKTKDIPNAPRLDFPGLVLLMDSIPPFAWAKIGPLGASPAFEVTQSKDQARAWTEEGLEVVTLVRQSEVRKMVAAATFK